MKKYGIIYIWLDKKHKRYYIGSHWGNEVDGYICSSSWMKKAYKKRPQDFKRRILKLIYTDRKDLLIEESKFLERIKDKELGTRYYNLTKHLNGHWASEDNSKSITEKISIKTKEAMNRPEVRNKYLDGLKKRNTRSSDIDVRNKRSETMKQTLKNKHPDGIPGNSRSTRWWNDGSTNKRSVISPGESWKLGRV